MPSVSGSYADLYYKYKEMQAAGKDSGNSKSAAKLFRELTSRPEHEIVKQLKNQLIEFDRQIEEVTPHLELTEDEVNAFMEKAIADIEPWYKQKASEIELARQEGQIQTAEDTLIMIRDVQQEIGQLLSQYDLRTAQTEEEFVNRMAELTSRETDDLTQKRLEWGQRIENVKLNQIQKGVFSSGIGKKKRDVEEALKETELGSIERRYDEMETEVGTTKKYTLEQISLARQSAEQDRIRRIGTPGDIAQKEAGAQDVLGYGLEGMPDRQSILSARQERGVSPLYGEQVSQRLRTLGEDRGTRELSRHSEYVADERARREAEWGSQLDKLKAEQAKKAKVLQRYKINA